MKKILLVALMLLFAPLTVYAEDNRIDRTPLFTDDNFRAAVLEVLTYLNEGEPVEYIYYPDILQITRLEIPAREIESLAGVELLINLEFVNVDGNYLTELYFPGIPGNTRLEYLHASGNNLELVNLQFHGYLRFIDLRNNYYLDIDNLVLPWQFHDFDLDDFTSGELLLVLDAEGDDSEAGQGHEPVIPIDDLPINISEEHIKQAMFEALNLAQRLEGARENIDVYLRVRLTEVIGGEYDWVVHAAVIPAPETRLDPGPLAVIHQPEQPDMLVTVFAWILAISAILGLVLSIILFAVRKA